jgi:hypothetical protein
LWIFDHLVDGLGRGARNLRLVQGIDTGGCALTHASTRASAAARLALRSAVRKKRGSAAARRRPAGKWLQSMRRLPVNGRL